MGGLPGLLYTCACDSLSWHLYQTSGEGEVMSPSQKKSLTSPEMLGVNFNCLTKLSRPFQLTRLSREKDVGWIPWTQEEEVNYKVEWRNKDQKREDRPHFDKHFAF